FSFARAPRFRRGAIDARKFFGAHRITFETKFFQTIGLLPGDFGDAPRLCKTRDFRLHARLGGAFSSICRSHFFPQLFVSSRLPDAKMRRVNRSVVFFLLETDLLSFA